MTINLLGHQPIVYLAKIYYGACQPKRYEILVGFYQGTIPRYWTPGSDVCDSYTSKHSPKGRAQSCVFEAESEQSWRQHSQRDVHGSEIDGKPHEKYLNITLPRQGMTLVRLHTLNAACFKVVLNQLVFETSKVRFRSCFCMRRRRMRSPIPRPIKYAINITVRVALARGCFLHIHCIEG